MAGRPAGVAVRLLAGCTVESFDENAGRSVDRLLRESGTSDVVDAHVVLIALRYRSPVVTSDVGDLGPLVEAVGGRVPLHEVSTA